MKVYVVEVKGGYSATFEVEGYRTLAWAVGAAMLRKDVSLIRVREKGKTACRTMAYEDGRWQGSI